MLQGFDTLNRGGWIVTTENLINALLAAALFLTVAGIAVYVFFLRTLQRALDRCAPRNRAMPPGQVWLCLVPLFGIAWQFLVVSRVAESLRREFAARQMPFPPDEDFGKRLGITGCALSLSAIIPFLGVLTGLAGCICWIVYWVRISGYSQPLEAATCFPALAWEPPLAAEPLPSIEAPAQGAGWPLLMVLLLGCGATALARSAMSALSFDQRTALNLSWSEIGWVFSAFTIGLMAGYFVMTAVTVAAGTRWGAFVSLAGTALAASGAGVVQNLAGLIAVRLLLGFFVAGLLPAAIQTVREYFPARIRPFAIGLYLASGQVAYALASPLHLWGIRSMGWRTAFLVTGIPPAIAAALCLVLWPAKAPREPSRGVSSAAIASAGMLAVGLFLTAPATWFISAWFASFANRNPASAPHVLGMASAVPLAAGACGAILAGAIAWGMMSSGMSAWRTRAILLTVWMPPLLARAATPTQWPLALVLIAVCSAACQGWYTLLHSAAADTLPARGVAIGAAIGALLSSVGAMLASEVWGRTVGQAGNMVLPGAAIAAGLAVLVVALLAWLARPEPEA